MNNKNKSKKNNYKESLIKKFSLKEKYNISPNKNNDNDIFKLIENNNIEKLKKLLNKDHSKINSINKDGFAPLHISVIKGNIDIIYILLLNGANPNILTLKKKQTPLHLAYIFQNSKSEQIIKYLKKFKANENIYDIENKRPIDYYLNISDINNDLNSIERVIFNNKRKKSNNKIKSNIKNKTHIFANSSTNKNVKSDIKHDNFSKMIFKIEGDLDNCENNDIQFNNDSKETIKKDHYYQINIKNKNTKYYKTQQNTSNIKNKKDNILISSFSDSLEQDYNNKPKNNNNINNKKNQLINQSRNPIIAKNSLSFNYPNLYNDIINNNLKIQKYNNEKNKKISKNNSYRNIYKSNDNKIDDDLKDIIKKKRQSIIFRKSNSYFKIKKNTKNNNSIFSSEIKYINNFNTDYNQSIDNIPFINSKDKNVITKVNSITRNNTSFTTENQSKKKNSKDNVTVITNKDVVEFKYGDSFSEDNNNTGKKSNNNSINKKNIIISTTNTIINNASFNVLNKDILTENYYSILTNKNNNININNKIKDSIILKSCNELKYWLENIGLSTYYQNFIENDIYNINILINQMKNPDNKLGYENIESILKIHKPGHIYRLLCSLEIDAGLIDPKIVKFLIKKNKNKSNDLNKSNGKLKLSVSQEINNCVNCLRISFLTSKKKNNLKCFLNRYNIMNFYQNFYHNGFEFINFVMLQMYSSEPIDENILENCFHIYEPGQRDIVLKSIISEKNKINYFLNSNEYLDFELKDMIKYDDIIFEENENKENEIMKIQKNNACTDCILF